MRIAIALLTAMVLGACGEDTPTITLPEGEPSPEQPATGPVDVVAVEYEFKGIPETLAAGETTLTMENAGEEQHELSLALILTENPIEELIELTEEESEKQIEDFGHLFAKPGRTDELTIKLEKGRYGYVCFVESPDGTPHAFRGMLGEFEVA